MNPDHLPHDADDAAGDALMERYRTSAGVVAFHDGFTDRVLARLERSSADLSPTVALERVFLKLAPLAAAAVLLIATMNVLTSRTSGQPLVDRVLGLKTVTLAAAYTLDTELTGDGVLSR